MAEFAIAENFNLVVGVHYNKFVKLCKFKKSVSLSAKSWRFLVVNKYEVDRSLKDNSEFGLKISESKSLLRFTEGKSLRIGMYRNQPYVTLCENFVKDGDEFTKHLSLTKNEWNELKQHMDKINDILAYDVIYRNANGEWTLLADDTATNPQKRLVPRMCSKTFRLQLCVYILTEAIKNGLQASCYGCINPTADPNAHMHKGFGCQADWESIVRAKLDDTKRSLNLEQAITKINEAMSWKMPVQELESESELYDVMVSHKALKSCEPCHELLPIYWDMYNSVLS